jgi:hypothetical protein
MSSELAGLLIGLVLTLFIYSYLLGDNPLYRLAVHILVGVSAAYAAIVVARQAIWPVFQQMQDNSGDFDSSLWLIPILLAVLLLLKRVPAVSWLGNSTVALLVGVGAAVALTGAIRGTLWPQVVEVQSPTPIQGILIALLTVCTLFTFQFTGKIDNEGEWVRPVWQRGFVMLGQVTLSITFGALFISVFNTSLLLLIDRIYYLLDQVSRLLS